MHLHEKDKDNDKHITCDCCNSEIPLSAALTPEGMDYTRHFCGTECFEKWRKQKNDESTE